MKFEELLNQAQQLPVSFQMIEGCMILVRDEEPFTLEEVQYNLNAVQGNREKAEIDLNRFFIVTDFIDGRADYHDLSAAQLLKIARALVKRFKSEWRKTALNRDCFIAIDGEGGAEDEPLEVCIISKSVPRSDGKTHASLQAKTIPKRRSLYVVSAIFAVLLGWMLLSPTLTNCWMLVSGNGFFIPDESSVFSFRITEMNPGSGEWWLHGEDKKFYFAYGQTEGAVYHAFPKEKLVECPNLDPLAFATWCEKFVLTKTSPLMDLPSPETRKKMDNAFLVEPE
ncbi:MAG: hypothetical protein AAGD22_12865 [Verrucomicrobiota bacterium]